MTMEPGTHSKTHLLPCLSVWCLLLMTTTGSELAAKDIVIADFKGSDYGTWKTTGVAFGAGPTNGCACSNVGGDVSTGTLTSPEFTIERGYINMLLKGGNYPDDLRVDLLVGGKAVRSTSGSHMKEFFWFSWDVLDLKGSKASILVTDNNVNKEWGYIALGAIEQSDVRKVMDEVYRPQFHITAQWNHINDPNGLVYYDGEYHVFHQWSPLANNQHGKKYWGHLVSKDLVHWEHLPCALTPVGGWGAIGSDAFSGSAVVDHNNTSGFQTGSEKPVVLIWTAIGSGQFVAYSNDRGRTFTWFKGNPVLPPGGLDKMNRDPVVRWQKTAGTHGQWVMVLPEWDGTNATYTFYRSDDLKTWAVKDTSYKHRGDCPDCFQLPVDGNPNNMKWLMHGANAGYALGEFTGTTFVDSKEYPEGTLWKGHQYATQTFADAPGDRKIMMVWVVGGKEEPPGMPYSQMLSFPVDLKLRTFPEGLRAIATPIPEIALLHKATHSWRIETVVPGTNLVGRLNGDLFDIRAEFEIGTASEFGFRIRGKGAVSYDVTNQQARLSGDITQSNTWKMDAVKGRVKMQILVDRSIIEAFYDEGRAYIMSTFYPDKSNQSLELFSTGGNTRLISLDVYELKSAWDRPLRTASTSAPQKTNKTQ